MAACQNHPLVEGSGYCANCGGAFCPACLTSAQGRNLCTQCRSRAYPAPPPIARGMLPNPDANSALTYAIVGLFCLGIILEPIALSKAINARRMIASDPRLGGEGQATAAMIISIIGLGLWVIGGIVRILTLVHG